MLKPLFRTTKTSLSTAKQRSYSGTEAGIDTPSRNTNNRNPDLKQFPRPDPHHGEH